MNRFATPFLILLFSIIATSAAFGTSYYSQGSVAPNLLNSWNTIPGGGGTSPLNFSSGDLFIIQNTHSMTTNAVWNLTGAIAQIQIDNGGTLTVSNNVTVEMLTVNTGGVLNINGGILQINNGNGGGDDLIVNGTVYYYSDNSISYSGGATGQVTNTGVFYHAVNGGTIPLFTWAGNARISVTGVTNATTINGLNQSFREFRWNSASQTSAVQFNSQLQTVDKLFLVISTGTGSIVLFNSTANMYASYFEVDGGTVDFTIDEGVFPSITINSSGTAFTQLSGTTIKTSGAGSKGLFKIGNDVNNISQEGTIGPGAVGFHILPGSFVDPSNSDIDVTGDFIIDSGAYYANTNYTNNYKIVGSGNFELRKGGHFYITDPNGITNSPSLSGSVQVTGSRVFSSEANFYYWGVSAMTMGNASPDTFKSYVEIWPYTSLTFSKSHTVTGKMAVMEVPMDLNGNNLTVDGTLIDSSGFAGWYPYFTGSGNFTLSSGASITVKNLDGLVSSGSSGLVQNSGPRIFSTGANYTYNGYDAQTTGTGLPPTVNNFSVITSAGTTLTNNLTVDGTFFALDTFTIGSNTLSLNGGVETSGMISSNDNGTVVYNSTVNGQNVITNGSRYGNLTFSNYQKNIPSDTIFVSNAFTPSGADHIVNSASVFNFNGTGTQAIPGFRYAGLKISKPSGDAVFPNSSTDTVHISGTFISGPFPTYTTTGSTVEFNSTTVSQYTGYLNYHNLVLRNTYAKVAIGAAITVNGLLDIGGQGLYLGATNTDSASEVVVRAGATLELGHANASLTVNDGNGSGDDLIVHGVIQNSGSLLYGSGATGLMNGTYRENRDGGTIPTFTWGSGSTVEILGILSATTLSGLNQAFHNFYYYSPSQSSVLNFNSQLTNVAGTFDIQSTGTGSIVPFNTDTKLTVGKYNGYDGIVNLSTTPGAQDTIEITGSNSPNEFALPFGTITITGGSGAHGVIRFNGANQTGSSSGTISADVEILVSQKVSFPSILSINGPLIVEDGGTLYHSEIIGTGSFELKSGGTIVINEPNGITESANSGSIRVSGTRTYSKGGKYYYDHSSYQVTGDGLPDTVSVLSQGNSVSLDLTKSVVVSDLLRFDDATGTLDLGTDTLVIGGGTFGFDSNLNSGAGTVIYSSVSDGQGVIPVDYYNLIFSDYTKNLNAGTYKIFGTFDPGTSLDHSINPASTFEFADVSTLNVPPLHYGNLTINGNRDANNVIFSSTDSTYIRGNLVLGATFSSGGYQTAGSKIVFNGSGAQTLPDLDFSDLIVSKSSGNLTLSADITVTDDLALLLGTIDDNGFILTVNGNIEGSLGQHISSSEGGLIVLTVGSGQHNISDVDLWTVELNDVNGAATTAAPGIKDLILTNGIFDISNGLYILNGGSLSASGGGISSTGFINFNGTASVTGTYTFNNVTLEGAVNFAAGSTVEGVLQLNNGGSIFGNALDYADGSVLRYNTGGTINRDLEWSSTSGAGYPYAVEIKNNTTLDLGANSGQNISREVETDLSIESGSALTMNSSGNEMTAALIVRGSITNSGTLELSGQPGGYLQLFGDLTQTGVLTGNLSAVRMTGTTPQHFTKTGGGSIALDSLVIASADSVVVVGATTLSVNNGFVMESGIFNLGTSSLDIVSGNTLTVSGGEFVNAGHTVNFTGGGSISGSLILGTVTTSGALDPGTDLTITGQLIINNLGSIVNNAPNYDPGSTLVYNYNSVFERGIEWSATSGAGYPYHVALQNNTYLRLGASELTTYRQMAGDLTIASGSTLNMNDTESGMTAALGVLGDITNNGELRLSSDPGGDLSVGGDFNNAGDFFVYARTVTFNGSAAQSLTGVLEFADLEINNTVSNVTMNDSVLVNGMLTLQNGKIDTGTDTLTIGPSGDVTTFGNNYVIGNLRKTIPAGNPTVMFEIGDATRSSPAEILFAGVFNSGLVTVSTSTSGPALTGSLIDPNKNLDRYWTITNTGTDFSQAVATFIFDNAEVDGGATTTNFDAKRWDGVQWNDQTPTGWSSGSTDVNFLTSFGTFALGENISHNITSSSNTGGSISPNGITSVVEGNNQGYTITPDAGYYIDYVNVDGVNQGAITSHTFTNVTETHTIDAYFAINTYSITVNTFGNGSISPGSGSVNYGSNNSYTISPDPGYHIDSVLADGVNVGAVLSHDFNSVAATHTLDAYFSIDTYSITVNSFGSGSISPGTGSVNYGSNNSYTISPDPGYHVDSVLADGVNVGAVLSHDFNSVSAAHTLDAYFSIDTYSITVNTFGNGSVSPGTGSVNYGSNNSYTISPDPGYHIDSVLVDGSNLGAITSHDFNSVTAAHTLGAYFSIDTYSITVNSFGNGSVSPGTGSVNYGSNNTYTISPDPGYHIDSVLADGINVGAVSTHDFNSVTAAHSIDAYFSINTYSITVNAFGNGTVSPGSGSVNYGSNNTFSINPDPGYHIDSVLADGVNVGAVSSYDFNAVSAVHTIDAYFSINTYSITVNSFGNGSVSPGTGSVIYGSNNTFTISPDPGYHIDSVLADGVNVGAVSTHDFNSVNAAHTIDAYFSIDTYSITVNSFGNGSVSPGTGSVNYGSNNTYTISPDPGYHIDSVVVGGVKTDSLSSYTIINATSSQTINAYFSVNYAVTFQVDMRPAIQHGKFVPSTDSVILRGSIAPLNWTGRAFVLSDGNNDSIYTLTAELYGIDSLQFKYVMIHRGLEMWERETPVNQNRIVVLTGSETLPVESFDDLPVYTPLFGAYGKDATTYILLHLDEDPSTGRTNYSPLGYALFDHSLKGNNGYRQSMNFGPGRFGSAISPADSNFVVKIPDDAMLHSTDLTAEGWFRFAGNTGNKVLMAKTAGSGMSNSFIIYYTNGTISAGIGTTSGIGPILSAPWTPVVGDWYHIAYTFDDNNDLHTLYVNGVSLVSGANVTSIGYDAHPVLIGAEHENEIVSNYFDGNVDEVRISSSVRIPSEFNLQLPPTDIAAVVTDTVMDLSWSNGGGSVPVSRYRIYRGLDSTSMVLIDSSYTTGFSETLPNGPSIYYYRTTTVDSTGFEGAKSFAVSDTIPDVVAPVAPANLASVSGDAQLQIHWNPVSAADFKKYYIYMGTGPNPTTVIDSASAADDTLKTYSGLTNYTEYYFRVAAKDTNGNLSGYSNEVSAVPFDQTAPAAPVSLNATPNDEYVDLTWTANSESDFAKYYIYGGTSPNPVTKIDSVLVIGNSFRTVVNLINYTTYYYRIAAADTSGNISGYSNEVSVSPIDLNPPSVPENMTAVAGNGTIELKWNRVPESDFSKYYIYRGITANPTTIVDSTADASDTLRVFSGLTNGTLYYMKVAAKDSNGNISMSDEKRAVPVVEAGNAMLFNGTDGNVQTPIISLTGDFTLEAWVKPGVPTDYRPIVSKNTNNGFGNETAEFNLQVQNDGNLNFFMGNGSGYALILDGGILTPGQWYHVAVTMSGSTVRMYRNGVETMNSNFIGSRIYNNLPVEIGKYNNGSIQFFDGEMDEVRIWNIARTEAQIRNAMVKNLRGDTPDLVGLYHMDEPVSTTNTYDASPYNHTGSLENGVSFVAGTGAMAPFAPVSLVANVSDGQVQIGWTPNSESDFNKYYVYRGTSPNPSTIIDSITNINDVSRTYSGLSNYTDYYFRVAAADQNGNLSPYSNEIAAMPVDMTAPAAPQNLTAVAGDGQISIYWNPVSGGDVDKYYIYYGLTPNPTTLFDSTAAVTIDDTLRTYSGLTNYTEYYFRVSARDTSGNISSLSNEVSAVPTDLTAPAPPSSPMAAAGDGSVDLSWDASVESDYAKYYVYGGTTPNPSMRIDSIFSVNATLQTYSGLTNYTTYYYRITSVDTSGNESSRSVEVSATPSDMTSPSAPQNLSALAGDGQATIHWNPVGDADFHRYYVYMNVTPNPITLFDSSSAPNDTLKIFEGLANNQTYYFRVASKDVNGNLSSFSNEIAVTPYDQTVPDAPQNLIAAAGNGQLQLRWNFVGDADLNRYRIYAGTSPNPVTAADSTDLGNRYDTLHVLKGLTNGTEYFVRITTVDSTGNESAFGNEVSGTPMMFTAFGELNPDSATVVLLHMNEPSGTDVKDVSGYWNDGTAYSGSAANAPGKFGSGRDYDGTAQAKVVIPASPSITFGSGDFTAEMFVKTTSAAASQRLFFRYTGHSTKVWTVNLGFGAAAGILNFDGLGAPSINGTRSLNDGMWHHIAAVRSDDSVFLYADGRLEGSGPVVEPDTAGGSLFVGGDNFNPDGTIDEVRLSNIARAPESFNLQLAPKDLAANAAGTTINLSWNNGGGAAPLRRYYIYRGSDSTAMTIIDSTVNANYADAGLASSTEYYYRITAKDSSGFESVRSYAAEAMTDDVAPPANPQGLTALAGDGSVLLHWNPNTESDFAKYYIYAGTAIYPTTVVDSADGGLNDTLKIISGLTNYQQYYFRLRAIDTLGNISGYSDQSGGIPTDTTKPSVPQNLTAVAGDQQITIRWSPVPNSDFAKYYIYLSLLGNSSVVYDSLTAVDDTVKVLTGLNNYTGYFVRITAVDTNGNISDYSTEVSSMPSDMTAPSAPSSLTVVDSMASYFTIVWNMNTENDIAKYYIYRDTVPNVTTLIDSTVNAVDTVRAFTTLTIGQPYYFRVAAVDTSYNVSPLSNTATAVPFMIYGISSYSYGDGSITPSGTTYVDHGDSLQFTIHAAALNHIDSITIDAPIILEDALTAEDKRKRKTSEQAQQKILSSDPITIFGTGHDDTLRTYTFQNVTAGHTIRAYFAMNSFLIDAQAFGSGTITPDGSTPVNQGSTIQYFIAPDLYHHLDSVVVDGVKVDSTDSYTFENVISAHTIAAYFSPNELHHFEITNSDFLPINPRTAGQSFTIVTRAVDSLGNPVNTFTGNVWFSSTDSTIAVLGGDYSIPFTAGQHGPQIVTLYRGGMNTITVIDSVSGKSGTSVPFMVNGAGLHHFSVTDTSGSGIPDQVENRPFPVTITAHDIFNNIQEDFIGTVEVAVSGAVISLGEGVTPSFAGGILTPHIMQIENSAPFVISVADPISEKSGTSGLFMVVPDTNIIFTASINGTITPTGAHPVSYGDTVIITFTPFAGHHFDSLYVDGVRVLDSVSQYTFFDVTATHTIDVYNSVNLNVPPLFTSILTDTAIARFDSLSFDYQALDPDLGTLRFALESAPPGAVIDSVTGELKYVPAAEANGLYTFIVKVYDDSLASAYDTVKVRVNIYGDVSGNGAVSAFDGAMVLQNVVSAITFNPLQEKVGDVTGAGGISSLDASYILQYAVGMISSFPGGLGKSTQTDAVLSAFSFRIQKSEKPDEYDLFVSVNKASNVYGIAMSLGFDSSIVTPLIMSKTASTDSMSMAYRFPDGSANLALAGITPLTSAGDIIKFTFRLKDPKYPKNAVLFTMKRFILNETDHTNDIGGITLNVRNLAQLPTVYKLEQNFPNPFNPSTTINYQLPEAGSVRIVIYNMLGQMVKMMVNEEQSAGFYSMIWNGRDESNRSVASGVYLYRIEALGPNNKRFTEVKKMLLVK